MTGTLTLDDVPAVVRALLAKATIPGPPLRRATEELRTWLLLAVHPDDEARMSALVAADPWLTACYTVQASQIVDPGMAYIVNQDKLKPDLIGDRIYPEPARPMPSWLRDDLYYSACVPKPFLPFLPIGPVMP